MTIPEGNLPKDSEKTLPKNHKRNRIFLILVGVIGCIIVVVWLFWLLSWRFRETTDDAYVSGNAVVIMTQVSGTPIEIFVQDTDCVNEGQPLVNLDPKDYQETFEKAKATLILSVQQVRQIWENVHVSSAEVVLRKAQLQKAQQDYDNRSHLIDVQAVSKEDWEHAQTGLATAEASVKVAESQRDAALAALGKTKPEEHPLIQQARVKMKEAYFDLQRCKIQSPVAGLIAQKHVQLGETLQSQTPLMSIIPLDQLWIDANLLETQLKNVRLGQSVQVRADLYGNQVIYQGEVQGISAGTGSVFSLLPPQNATGNWIKIVQRVPVRVRLKDPFLLKQFPLRLGLSVQVQIDTHDTSGKMLTEAAPSQVIASTSVFNIPTEGLEHSMDEIIQQHLSSCLCPP